ncbi:MAG: VWA domain-containing protein [bacterium]|nr:VWA domain-containing protein [bacterium]
MFRTSLVLLLFLVPVCGASARSTQDAESAFRAALQAGELEGMQGALDALVATGDAGAVATIVGEYARCVTALRKAEREGLRLDYAIDNRRRMLADLELRAERDESLENLIVVQRESVVDMQNKRDKQAKITAHEGPWRTALGGGTRKLFDALSTGKRRGAEKRLLETAADEPDLAVRLATVELLGEVGGAGTAVTLQKMLAGFMTENIKLKKKIPKERAEVRKMEARLQKAANDSGGRFNQAMMQQYNRTKEELARMRRTLFLTGLLSDACVEAGAVALLREDAESRRKSVQTLGRALKKAKDGVRLRTLHLLGRVGAEQVIVELRGLLEAEKDPIAVGQLLFDLAHLGDEALVEPLLTTYVIDENWHVQRRALDALKILRPVRAIPVLIERIEVVEGRPRTDVQNTLISLTGQNYRTNAELWKRWWADNADGFVVPPAAEVDAATAEAKKAVGVTFFGITTESQRVLFVLDLSGSMKFSMVARGNPTDDPGKPYDMPREGEISRMTAARRALKQAMGGLQDGALFNLVLYASDVWSWRDKLVTMDAEVRGEVMDFVDSIEAVGATNIYGAIQQALELAGAEDSDEWAEPAIDTIFVLSDGRASVGVTTDADEILGYVREVNRSAGIVIHTIGLSGAQDAYLLRNLAEQNGGTYAAR